MATLKTQKQIEIEREEERQKRKLERQREKAELMALEEELRFNIEMFYSKNKKIDFTKVGTRNKIINYVIDNNKTSFDNDYIFYYLCKKYDKHSKNFIKKQEQRKIEIANRRVEERKSQGLSQATLNNIRNDNVNLGHKKIGNMTYMLLSLFFK